MLEILLVEYFKDENAIVFSGGQRELNQFGIFLKEWSNQPKDGYISEFMDLSYRGAFSIKIIDCTEYGKGGMVSLERFDGLYLWMICKDQASMFSDLVNALTSTPQSGHVYLDGVSDVIQVLASKGEY